MNSIIRKINKKDAYLINTENWFDQTSTMTPTERGIFFELSYYQQMKGSLPTETMRLARVAKMDEKLFVPIWENIKHNFKNINRLRRISEWIIPPKHNGSFLDIENRPGVYAFYAFLGNPRHRRPVVYIGKAKNLNSRLSSHEIDKMLDDNGIYASCKIKYCDNPSEFETELIKKIKPIFNLQHNKEFVKNVYFGHVIGKLQKQKEENIG